MAFSPTSQTANLATAGISGHYSPYTPSSSLNRPISKRDKKRMNIADRFVEIGNKFAANRDAFFRAQVQSLQANTNLIQVANLYNNKPLDENGDDLTEDLPGSATTNTHAAQQQALLNGSARAEAPTRIGRHAAQFMQEINDAMEQRDADLTTVAYRHNFRIHEILKDHEYNVAVAHQEHEKLVETLRQRLIASASQKKAALQKEKEKLDLADTNALLYHPNQFSLNNGASPGGPQSNRKTRHTRHRLDIDDVDTAGGNNRRKRKAFAEIENGSPVPAGREIDPRNPFKEADAKLEAHQNTAPLYTLDRLFSTRELDAHFQAASFDVIGKFKRRKILADNHTNPAFLAPTNADVTDPEDNNAPAAAADPDFGTDGATDEGNPFLTAPLMERSTTNQSYHATRSTRVLNLKDGISAREELGDLAGRQAAAAMIGTYQREKKKEEEYMRAPPLSEQEAEIDVAMMKAAIEEEDGGKVVNSALLDEMVEEREDFVVMPGEG